MAAAMSQVCFKRRPDYWFARCLFSRGLFIIRIFFLEQIGTVEGHGGRPSVAFVGTPIP